MQYIFLKMNTNVPTYMWHQDHCISIIAIELVDSEINPVLWALRWLYQSFTSTRISPMTILTTAKKSMHEKLFWNFIMNLNKILTFSKRFLSPIWIKYQTNCSKWRSSIMVQKNTKFSWKIDRTSNLKLWFITWIIFQSGNANVKEC